MRASNSQCCSHRPGVVVGGKCQRAGLARSGTEPLIAIRAGRWADAQAAAARFADPVAEKLVLYFRLRAPGAATAAEIADFMQRNPDWPAQSMLEQRRQEAIATDPDDADVLVQCAANSPGVTAPVAALPLARPSTAGAMLRCAEALANAGRGADANETARQAWVATIDDPAPRQPSFTVGPASSAPTINGRVFSAWHGPTRRAPLARSPASTTRTTPRPRLAWPSSAMTRRRNRWWQRCRPRCATIPA